MANMLEVKNLKVSFRTNNGTVKAVRDISFDLEKGRTLAIVGESGSGKSVTSKSILGILAGNSIIEGGSILYDGKDLLKIPEEEMCEIRGDKISMIFQDPLSALNPIVKIGRQITEAMLLKNKVSRKNAKNDFNSTMKQLHDAIIAAPGVDKEKGEKAIQTFDKFSIESTKLENLYDQAQAAGADTLSAIEDFLFKAEKKQNLEVKKNLKEFITGLNRVKDPVIDGEYGASVSRMVTELERLRAEYAPKKDEKGSPVYSTELISTLEDTAKLLSDIDKIKDPNFFAIAYCKLYRPEIKLSFENIAEEDEKLTAIFNEDFLDEFKGLVESGLRYSDKESLKKKSEVIPKLLTAVEYYKGSYDKKAALKQAESLSDEVEASINKLDLNKDSMAYTFRSSLTHAIEKYYFYETNNPKEEARFERQTRRLEKLKARGANADYKVVPKNILDLNVLKTEIVDTVSALAEHYIKAVGAEEADYRKYTDDLVEYFRSKASDYVYHITKQMAKEKAIKLMDEVGIPDARTRYYQYPFEFSGGMRQRIVIAIALAANPDILICDEPTTALDVTIQAQILELINDLKRQRNLSVIFITHDLGVVANMADDIAVMYAGKIVEYGTAEDIFYDPRHPYTWALLSSMPDLDTKEKLDAIPGTPPNMIYPPVGDAFAERNKYALDIDFEQQPPMFKISETHAAATWLLHPDAPKVEKPAIITERIERMLKKSEVSSNV